MFLCSFACEYGVGKSCKDVSSSWDLSNLLPSRPRHLNAGSQLSAEFITLISLSPPSSPHKQFFSSSPQTLFPRSLHFPFSFFIPKLKREETTPCKSCYRYSLWQNYDSTDKLSLSPELAVDSERLIVWHLHREVPVSWSMISEGPSRAKETRLEYAFLPHFPTCATTDANFYRLPMSSSMRSKPQAAKQLPTTTVSPMARRLSKPPSRTLVELISSSTMLAFSAMWHLRI